MLVKTIRLMSRLLVVDQQGQLKKPGELFKMLLQKGSHHVCLQLADEHPNAEVKQVAMEHLALITSMPEIFIYIQVTDFFKVLMQRAFNAPASATTQVEINCQAFALNCINNLSCSDLTLFEDVMLGQGGEKYQDQEMIEKFESILMRGNAQVTN